MGEVTAFPTDASEFAADDRVLFDRVTQTYKLEDEEGNEWEWLEKLGKWRQVTDEAMREQQQQAYRIEGVDDNEPAVDQRKRKATDGEGNAARNGAKKLKPDDQPRAEQKNKAVYVTSLPQDTTEDELYDIFSKFGVIAESAEGDRPRIKLYKDEDGKFKGDALIVYFRPESVQLAIDMLDETDFRLGQQVQTGPMRVKEADASFKAQKDQPLASEEAKKKGTGANRDRQRVIKKNQEMNSRLADWDDDEPSTIPDTSSRWDKVVVLKHMFTLQELETDPAALLEVKEDVREECEKFGQVTNVVLYDKEEDGVMTVRFGNTVSAEACVRDFDGRWFDQRKVEAYISDGTEKFKKTRKQDEDQEEEEKKRLERFGKFIEQE